MALATAAATAVATAISIHPFLSRPACVLCCGRRLPPLLLRASSTSTSDFNITFAEPAPSKASGPGASAQPLVPWITRGEDGKPCLHTSPPPDVLWPSLWRRRRRRRRPRGTRVGARRVAPLTPPSPVSRQRRRRPPRPRLPSSPRRPGDSTMRISGRASRSVLPRSLPPQEWLFLVASRRTSEELIFEGKVTVNGSVCTSPQTKVDISKDSIYVNGNRISKKLPPKLYFAVNKPKRYICSSGEESKSIISLFDDYLKDLNKIQPGIPKPRLFTVGRLDVATTGLIIVTNDGEFAQKVAHPSSNIAKEYVVTIDGAVHKKHLIAISEGTKIDGVKCIPDLVEPLAAQPDTKRTRLGIVVHEGRNHEVRELVQNAGLKVYALKHVRIGSFRLPSDLGIGKTVELKPTDIKSLEGNN